MSIQTNDNYIFQHLIAVLIGSLIIFTLLNVEIDIKAYYFSLHQELVNFLQGKLVYEKHIPHSLLSKTSGSNTVIYVLGGNQHGLRYRFKEASILYHQGLSNKILILSRPGITDFDSDLGRNLTNNEWAIMELRKFNVKKEDIEPVSVQASILGTLSEAMDLPDIIRKKGYSKVVLVTSAYHTKRTITVFSKVAPNSSLELYIYGSDDVPGFQGLLTEYMKMLLYENIVLPVYGRKETKSPEIRVSMHRPASQP
jgi:uncharacterized SAM-binding protein YcdF (DUF218 family)